MHQLQGENSSIEVIKVHMDDHAARGAIEGSVIMILI